MLNSSSPLLIAVMGTTASGKTDLAEAMADQIGATLVNADAFQVYRHLDIGTAKSSRKSEYQLVDIRKPSESFGVGEWVRLTREVLKDTSRPVIVVGGTGLYIRALFEGYSEMSEPPDPKLRETLNAWTLESLSSKLYELAPDVPAQIDMKNRVRVQRALERALSPPAVMATQPLPFRRVKFWIDRDAEDTNTRINQRVLNMVQDGWLQEVAHLQAIGVHFQDPGMRAHGYRHMWCVLEGTMEMSQAIELTAREVRHYAKRQRTWLRKEPSLIRLESDDPLDEALRRVLNDEEYHGEVN